jgi:indoleamine 2,3-dioxygenase
MPRAHRDFLNLVSKLTPLRLFVQNNRQNQDLVDAYDNCMKQLRAWRDRHLAVVWKYIARPARRAAEAAIKSQGGAGSSSDEPPKNDNENLRGTGGTALLPFLRQTRNESTGVEP